jgi:hypothetical protein
MGKTGMDSIVDLAKSRKARNEKNENVREASQDMLALLDHHRGQLPEEFLAFLLAMALSDQAIQLTDTTGDRQAGQLFMEEVFMTARQLFDAYHPGQVRPVPARLQHLPRPEKPTNSRVVSLITDLSPDPADPTA